jgi:REP element-mobilizing transposase RayT
MRVCRGEACLAHGSTNWTDSQEIATAAKLLAGYRVDMAPLVRRRSPRLAHFDYANPGTYFVTICAFRRRCLFGKVLAGMMQLSEAGRIAEQEWLRTAELRPYVDLDSHIVMPNHIHGLIIIRGPVIQHNVSDRSRRHSLPAIVGGFKAATSRRIATPSVDYQGCLATQLLRACSARRR